MCWRQKKKTNLTRYSQQGKLGFDFVNSKANHIISVYIIDIRVDRNLIAITDEMSLNVSVPCSY